MRRFQVIEGGLSWDADRAGAFMHRHMFDMVLRAAYGTMMQQPRMNRSLPLLLTLNRREINTMLATYNVRDRVDDTVLAQAMAIGLGEALHVAAPRSPKVDLFVEKALPRSSTIFHVVSRGTGYWNDLMRDGPAVGVTPQIEDVCGFYRDTLLACRTKVAEDAALASVTR